MTVVLLVLSATTVSMTGCGSSDPAFVARLIAQITMTDQDSFYPRDVSVVPGTEVVFTNRDTDPHTATADVDDPVPGGPNSAFDFPQGLGPGDIYVFRVPSNARPGTAWYYHCCNHGQAGNGTSLGPNMSGVIRVVAALGPTVNVNMTTLDSFDPNPLTVAAGTTVQCTNLDTDPHTATVDLANVTPSGPNSAFEYPRGLPTGAKFLWQVPSAAPVGTKWFYHCCNHGAAGDGTVAGPGMSGVIIVGP